jgi:hypothetical protein
LTGATEREWLADLERWLHDRFAGLCEALGQRALSSVRISPPLAEWEAKYFLLGLEDHLFGVDERGRVESELLRPSEETASEQRDYRIFSHEPPRLLRENICQLATAARLILERGWLKRHVALEPSRPEHRAMADGFDLLVRSTAGKILIWAEVKRTAVELEKLITDLRACSRRGPHAHQDCGFPQNHPRHEFCLSNQPAYLWAVAPDGEICLAVKCEADSLELEALPSLPPRSLLELG